MSKEAEELKRAIDAYRVVHGTDKAEVGAAQLRATVGEIQQRARAHGGGR